MTKEGKNTAPLAHVINDLNGEEIIGTFYEKELQKINQKEFRTRKSLKEKEANNMSNGKDVIILLITEVTKMMLYKDEPILF